MAFLGAITNPLSSLNIGSFGAKANWWMFDIDNKQLISLTTAPRSVSNTQSIKYTNLSVPGLDYEPSNYSGLGNPKISFSIQAIARNDILGNQTLIKQFENLRKPSTGLTSFFAKKESFVPNPRVLIQYGTGSSVPLVYFVKKCDMVHSLWTALGYPKVTDIALDLELDGTHPINVAETVASKAGSLVGMLQSAGNVISGFTGGVNKYL